MRNQERLTQRQADKKRMLVDHFTIAEVADKLNIAVSTVWYYIKDGRLKSVQVKGFVKSRHYIAKDEYARFKAGGK